MLSVDTENQLINLIKTIGREEKEIENIRIKLATMDNFLPYSAFQRINRRLANYIINIDIEQFLQYKYEVNFIIEKMVLK